MSAPQVNGGRFYIYKKIQGLIANRSAARAFALAASSSRFLAGAVVSSERRRRFDTAATSSTAAIKDASLAFEGLLKPVILRTNWSEAARTSSSVTGGSKLKRERMIQRRIAATFSRQRRRR